MAILPGVGPRFPQVVVLVGATGDLARRKLLPGLFHLSTVGFIPGCRVIGVSLDEIGVAEGQRIISIAFREPPKSMFPAGSGVGDQGPDHLTFDLADASKMSLSFYGKRPGPGMRLDKLSLQFAMRDTGLIGDVLEAYEPEADRRHACYRASTE